jgi:hypothetical protein
LPFANNAHIFYYDDANTTLPGVFVEHGFA